MVTNSAIYYKDTVSTSTDFEYCDNDGNDINNKYFRQSIDIGIGDEGDFRQVSPESHLSGHMYNTYARIDSR